MKPSQVRMLQQPSKKQFGKRAVSEEDMLISYETAFGEFQLDVMNMIQKNLRTKESCPVRRHPGPHWEWIDELERWKIYPRATAVALENLFKKFKPKVKHYFCEPGRYYEVDISRTPMILTNVVIGKEYILKRSKQFQSSSYIPSNKKRGVSALDEKHSDATNCWWWVENRRDNVLPDEVALELDRMCQKVELIKGLGRTTQNFGWNDRVYKLDPIQMRQTNVKSKRQRRMRRRRSKWFWKNYKGHWVEMNVYVNKIIEDRYIRIFGENSVLPPIETQKEETENPCVVCMSFQKDTAFSPCGHLACCKDCADHVKNEQHKCCICRKRVDSVLRIYFT